MRNNISIIALFLFMLISSIIIVMVQALPFLENSNLSKFLINKPFASIIVLYIVGLSLAIVYLLKKIKALNKDDAKTINEQLKIISNFCLAISITCFVAAFSIMFPFKIIDAALFKRVAALGLSSGIMLAISVVIQGFRQSEEESGT